MIMKSGCAFFHTFIVCFFRFVSLFRETQYLITIATQPHIVKSSEWSFNYTYRRAIKHWIVAPTAVEIINE